MGTVGDTDDILAVRRKGDLLGGVVTVMWHLLLRILGELLFAYRACSGLVSIHLMYLVSYLAVSKLFKGWLSNKCSIYCGGGLVAGAVNLDGDGAGARRAPQSARPTGRRWGWAGVEPKATALRTATAGTRAIGCAVRGVARTLGIQFPRRRQSAGRDGAGGRAIGSQGAGHYRPQRFLWSRPFRGSRQGTRPAHRVRCGVIPWWSGQYRGVGTSAGVGTRPGGV
ncbi:Uncharacterised protein [Mycobacteroides abscessus subsp. abscessus]|nr:Uncharacterised protein [Mycobacteroides abscessus subsp. abscessus]